MVGVFKVNIKLGNAAMGTPGDVADRLESIAETLRAQADDETNLGNHVVDLNGNSVGDWFYVATEDES